MNLYYIYYVNDSNNAYYLKKKMYGYSNGARFVVFKCE